MLEDKIFCDSRVPCYFLKFAGQVRLQFALRQQRFQEPQPTAPSWCWIVDCLIVPIPLDVSSVFL